MKPLVVAIALAAMACHSHDVTSAGRVEITQEGDNLVVRDSMHVLVVALARSTNGIRFEGVDLPVESLPGRVAVADEHGRAILVWITRLADKRPANIQRWFDDKIDLVRRNSKVIKDRGEMVGTHPARFADFVHDTSDRSTYNRFIGVDVPEHDLEVLVIGIVDAGRPTSDQMQWLDDLERDVRAIQVAPAR